MISPKDKFVPSVRSVSQCKQFEHLCMFLPRFYENDCPERSTTLVAITHMFLPTGAMRFDIDRLPMQKDITIEANHEEFKVVG